MQICILIENLPELTGHMNKEHLKKLSTVFSKSKGFGTIIFASGTREELKNQEENVAVKKAMGAKCVVIAEGNPVEYTFLKQQEFPVYANSILDEDEAVLLQDEKIRFVRYS